MKNWLTIVISGWLLISCSQEKITVGAKHFTEGYVVSEIIAQLLEDRGFQVDRKYDLGGTMICFEALRNHEIDVYPEYTGTISREILRSQASLTVDQLDAKVDSAFALRTTASLGFNNSYGLVVSSAVAHERGLRKISDLGRHPDLITAISYEFLQRQDGWPALAAAYHLNMQPVGIEHGLAYRALTSGDIALTDCYTTDAQLADSSMLVLEDDLGFFPTYNAVAFYRADINPAIPPILRELENVISESDIRVMNRNAEAGGNRLTATAATFLREKDLLQNPGNSNAAGTSRNFWKAVGEHIVLTVIAVGFAVLLALPLGVLLYWSARFANPVLYFAGLLQTVPSIALLAFMIPLFGIGLLPAVVALFLYALLPILRNTVSGLRSVDPLLKETATGMGMTRLQSLRWVEGPLAISTIIAGIRIAAVISVGTATLAAFIGAGGLGQYIVTGLALNDTPTILTGAASAAGLAIVIELLFELIERWLRPRHLDRQKIL